MSEGLHVGAVVRRAGYFGKWRVKSVYRCPRTGQALSCGADHVEIVREHRGDYDGTHTVLVSDLTVQSQRTTKTAPAPVAQE